MAELEVKQSYAPQRRVVKVCVDLPKYNTYKIRFEKEDNVNKQRVGIKCNNEHYTQDYQFKRKEPYILEIDSGFIGNICVESDGKDTLKFPILERGKEEITLALVQPKGKQVSKTTSAYKELSSSDESYAIVEIGNQYFQDLKDGTYTIKQDMYNYFFGANGLFSKSEVMAGMWGIPGDIAQSINDNVKLKAEFFKGLVGLKFETTLKEGRRFFVLIGYLGKESIQKTIAIAFSQGVNTALVTTQKVNPFVNATKTLIKGTWITTAIGSAISIYQANDKGFNNCVAIILGSFIKASASLLVGVIVTSLVLLSPLAPFAIVAGIGLSIVASFALNYVDEEYGGTAWLKEKLDELSESFNKKISEIEEDVDNALYRFYEDFRWQFYQYLNSYGNLGIPYEHFR